MKRLLLFGGSFDPIHHGHLIIARYVAEQLNLSRVLILPSATPPHKLERTLTPIDQRIKMCQLAVHDEPCFEVNDWEARQTGPNYTLHTIQHFRHELGPAVELCWLIGADSLNDLGSWYHAPQLVDACTLVTAARTGYEPDRATLAQHFTETQVRKLLEYVIESPRIDISSTQIRTRVANDKSIRYLVPDPVAQHIQTQQLYRSA